MSLACSGCNLDKPSSEYSPKQRNQPTTRLCINCRAIRDVDKIEAKRRGMQLCTVCKIMKRPDYFHTDRGRRRSECKECQGRRVSEAKRIARETATYVRCATCKTVKPVSEMSGRVTSSRFCRRCKECEARRAAEGRLTMKSKFSQAVGIAKRRNLTWNITIEDYAKLRANPCHYCGHTLQPTGVAIDRLDNHLGYTLDNVVPCCTECNLARGTMFTHEEMKIIGAAIRQIKDARSGSQPMRVGWGRPKKYVYDLPEKPHSEDSV